MPTGIRCQGVVTGAGVSDWSCSRRARQTPLAKASPAAPFTATSARPGSSVGGGGERAQRPEAGAGHGQPDVLLGRASGHPGRLDHQGHHPQVGTDQQVRAPRRQVLRRGEPETAVGRAERPAVRGNQHHHRAVALQRAYRLGQPVPAGQHRVGEAVPLLVAAGHDQPQAGVPGGGRQAVDARCGFRLDPQQGGESVAVGEAEQLAAGGAQPVARPGRRRGRARASGPAARAASRPPSGRRPGSSGSNSAKARSATWSTSAPGTGARSASTPRSEPSTAASSTSVSIRSSSRSTLRSIAITPRRASIRPSWARVPLASAAGRLRQRGQAQRGGPLAPGERHRRRTGRRTGGERPVDVPLDRAVRFRPRTFGSSAIGRRPVRRRRSAVARPSPRRRAGPGPHPTAPPVGRRPGRCPVQRPVRPCTTASASGNRTSARGSERSRLPMNACSFGCRSTAREQRRPPHRAAARTAGSGWPPRWSGPARPRRARRGCAGCAAPPPAGAAAGSPGRARGRRSARRGRSWRSGRAASARGSATATTTRPDGALTRAQATPGIRSSAPST